MLLLRILSGILALVLTVLGTTFTVIGLADAGSDPPAFRLLGAVLLTAGLSATGLALALRARAAAAARRRRDGARATATVLAARLHAHTRVGVLLSYTLTVRFTALDGREHTVTRTLLVPPTLAPERGDRLELAYDPGDPANFEPLRRAVPAPV